jgi:hypothetical protein
MLSMISTPVTALAVGLPAQRTIAQRFSALALSDAFGMSAKRSLSGEQQTLCDRHSPARFMSTRP